MKDNKTLDWVGKSEPLLIGLAGQMRSGKTTVGDFLEQKYGFVHLSFAAPIRRFVTGMCLQLNPTFNLERDKNKPQSWAGGSTPRQIMQLMGTEFGRQMIDPDIWVNHAMALATRHLLDGSSVVMSDVRFANESKSIIEHGGAVFQVVRPQSDSTQLTSHISEWGIPAEDVAGFVYNHAGVAELEFTVSKMMKMFLENGLHTSKPTDTLGEQQ
jgi:hypothetical protein